MDITTFINYIALIIAAISAIGLYILKERYNKDADIHLKSNTYQHTDINNHINLMRGEFRTELQQIIKASERIELLTKVILSELKGDKTLLPSAIYAKENAQNTLTTTE